jgi:RIO kinase 1
MSFEDVFDSKLSKKFDKKIQEIIDRIGLDRKTQDEVFDTTTLHTLEKLISDRIIDMLDFPISTGKEGNVFRAKTSDGGFVALKIYRTSTSTFKHISKYITGDPRFKSSLKNRREIIYEWTKKEFKNLQRATEAGVKTPKPIRKINNVLVMEYIGNDKRSAPELKDTILKNPDKTYKQLIKYIKFLYKKAQIVHGDFSQFNILIHNNNPYVIDLGQAVLIEHPLAYEFLRRDIENISRYFSTKYGIKTDIDSIYESICKGGGKITHEIR